MAEKKSDNAIWYWLLCAAAVLALLCLYLFDDAMPENTYDDCEITGRVEDTEGHPVVKFEITIQDPSSNKVIKRVNGESDSGSFAFSLPPGEHIMGCSAIGFLPYREPLTVVPPSAMLTIRLSK